jgi:hypothetical protein
MGKGCVLALLGLATVLFAFPDPASAGRHCRYEGKIFNQGDVVCIRVDGQTRLARCGMMLNNGSWNFLQDGCPTALLTPIPEGGRQRSCQRTDVAAEPSGEALSRVIHANVR